MYSILNIAVLITCYNRKEKTLRCLSALYKADIPKNHNLDVFLVDDGSTDGTSEAIKKQFSNTIIIQGSGQLYWNRGMHLAWQTAIEHNSYDFFLWLNDDVELFTDAIVSLIESSRFKDDNAIICGSMCSQFTNELTYGGNNKGIKIIPNHKMQICDTFNGNLVLIPKNVFKKNGIIDPVFLHSIGDFDYALRAKSKGVNSYIAPYFLGYCEKNQSLPKWCLPSVSFIKRIKSLYSPLGNSHPFYYFIFEKRYYGYFIAIFHFITIHLRVILPRLWKY